MALPSKRVAGKRRKKVSKKATAQKFAAKARAVQKAARKKAAKIRSAKPRALRARAAASTPVRASFVRRSVRLIERLAATAPEEGLVEALASPTDVGTLARALSNAAIIGSAVGELEPLAALIAKSAEDKQSMIREAGGLLATSDVAQLLGLTRQSVYLQRRRRKLLAVPHGGEEKFPAVQFANGQPLPGLARVLEVIGLQGAWGILDFLLAPDDDLDGLSPIQVLREHPERLEDVVSRAATEGEHGAG